MSRLQAPALFCAPAAEVQDLAFAYAGQRALDSLTLRVPSGSIFGLLGPNGSGKSTLLSLLSGLRHPQGGYVRVLGEPPSTSLRARIGILFQETCLDPLMTPRETLWLHGRLFGLPAPALQARAGQLLERLGLSDRADRSVSTLSGGMKRRLELARALLPSPQLLLLDEPTTGLDPESELILWEHLGEINRHGVTVILATNKVYEGDRYCDAVAFLHQGRLVAQGSPAELKANLRRDSVWVEWTTIPPALPDEIARWDGVGKVTAAGNVLHVTADAASSFLPRLFQAAQEAMVDHGIRAVRIRESTLEDAYFDIVGASLAQPQEPS